MKTKCMAVDMLKEKQGEMGFFNVCFCVTFGVFIIKSECYVTGKAKQ